MTSPYFTPTSSISIPKLINKRYFIRLYGTSDDIFRVPANGSYLKIDSTLSRDLRFNFEEKRTPDGQFRLVYKNREPIRMNLSVVNVDERDWSRLLGWEYIKYDVSLMEVHEDDVNNPEFFTLGPVEVEKWKILEVRTEHAPGNINVAKYTIVLEEADFIDEPVNDLYDRFFRFKYMIEVEKNGTRRIPSSWDVGDLENTPGLLIQSDISRSVPLSFSESSIAFGSQIVEYKGRGNIEISLAMNTSNLDEISLLEWAKDSRTPIKFYEWSLSHDVSEIDPPTTFIESRPFQIALTSSDNTYSGAGDLDPIAPTWWRIMEMSYMQDGNQEYNVNLTIKELF